MRLIHTPFKEMVAEKKQVVSNEPSPFSIKEDVSTQPSAPSSPNYALYLSSTVCGIKNRCIPILVYRKSYDYEEHIKRLMKKFSIDSFYLLETEEFIFGLSLKSISLERYVRIMNDSKSCNRSMLIRFKQVFIRISPLYHKGKIIKEKPKFLKKLGINDTESYCSRPHYNYLKSIDTDISKPIHLHGNKAKVTLTIVGDKNNR